MGVLCITGGNVKVQLLWKTVRMSIPQKLKTELPYDLAIPLLGTYPQNWKQRHVHSVTIHNRQKVETTQMFTHGWVDKQNMVYTYNGILSSLKKKENLDTCYNMHEPRRHYAKWNKPERVYKKVQYIVCSTGVVRFIGTESRRMVARVWGRGSGELWSMGTISVWEGEKVLEMHSGHGCTIMGTWDRLGPGTCDPLLQSCSACTRTHLTSSNKIRRN